MKDKHRLMHPDSGSSGGGTSYDINLPSGTLFDSNSWAENYRNFNNINLDFYRDTIFTNKFSENGFLSNFPNDKKTLTESLQQNSQPAIILNLRLNGKIPLLLGFELGINQNIYSNYPTLSLGYGNFSLNENGFNILYSLGTPLLNPYISFGTNYTLGLGLKFPNGRIGLDINLPKLRDEIFSELSSLNSELERWHFEAQKNIYNNFRMSDLP